MGIRIIPERVKYFSGFHHILIKDGGILMEVRSIESKMLAGISYIIWPLSLLIVLTLLKKDRFLRFHGYQALFLGLLSFVLYLVGGAFLRVIPVIGPLTYRMVVLLWFLFVLFLGYRCLSGDYFRIPVIYEMAQGYME